VLVSHNYKLMLDRRPRLAIDYIVGLLRESNHHSQYDKSERGAVAKVVIN
jgi:hypothetical protein